ncbi:MAG: PfkB family carbohydrate kinase [Candidatus Omnitrophica bacterium]|nr:PfkB family carbohydrate kinase [Candidatus Omnitrophota bacterium]
MSILVLGTVALDSIQTPSGKRTNLLGGSAIHFAMIAKLFTCVSLVSVIGEDFPEDYLYLLRNKNIDLSSLKKEKGSNFKWEVRYEKDLDSAITLKTELGVFSRFIPSISRLQRKIKYVFLANGDPDLQDYLLKKMINPRLICLDSMDYWIKHKRRKLLKLLKNIHVYLANDQEARLLSQEDNLIKAAKTILEFGPQMILIKKAEHGAILFSKGFVFSLPAYPVENVIDPTGAGDAFAGGFMGYLARVDRISPTEVKKAVVYGTIAGSFNIEDFGIERTLNLTLRDFKERLIRFKRIIGF